MKTTRSGNFDRIDAFITVLLSLLSFFLYLRTLVPGLITNDSGEFQALAFILDHAHTTGYEVYLLMAKIFTILAPVEAIAYRVSLFSAFCAGITIGLVYLSGRLVSSSKWGGAIGAVGLIISATFWSQSIIAEVYTAGSLFTAAILLFVLLYEANGSPKWLMAAGTVGGLSMGVHVSNILFAPAILVLLLQQPRNLMKARRPALLGAIIGIVLFISAFVIVDFQESTASILNSTYIPSASRWDLEPEYFDSFWGRFNFLFFARQWRSAMFVNPGSMLDNLGTFSATLRQDFSIPSLLLIPAGLISMFFREKRLGFFFLTAILVHNLYTLNYRIGDIFVFYMSLYVYLAVLMAEGAAVVMNFLKRLPGRQPWVAQTGLAFLLLFSAVMPFSQQRIEGLRAGEIRFEFMNLVSNRQLGVWHTLIQHNVSNLPPDAVVLMDWPDLYGYVYVAHVEQGRTGMLFMETYPYALKNGIADSLVDFLRKEIHKGRPVYSLKRIDELQRAGFIVSSREVGGSRMNFIEMR